MESYPRNPLVLHVEDDDGDAHLVLRCLSRQSHPIRIKRVADGRDAMRTFRDIQNGTQERPDLVLLDLKLPYYNGIEILRQVRAEEALAALPIVVLTSSSVISDIQACEEAGCTEYVVKPMDYVDLKSALADLCERRLSTHAPDSSAKEKACLT